jgi:AraC-like DNA-binding protein
VPVAKIVPIIAALTRQTLEDLRAEYSDELTAVNGEPLERVAIGGRRIIDVGLDSGYACSGAFIAMSREHFGVAPRAFCK